MGWETAAFVEKEPFCQKVLRKNFGSDIEIHDDIFTFSGRAFRGRVDIVTGGFPCQPFSAAGKRKGRADERHLFPEMLRVISEVEPRWVVAENVRGLLSIESGSVFAEVISSMEGQGYEVVTFCVPASAVEAPHRRDRLWIAAHNSERPRRTRRAGSNATEQDSNGTKDGLFEQADCDVADASTSRWRQGGENAGRPSEESRAIQDRVRPADSDFNNVADAGDSRLQGSHRSEENGREDRERRTGSYGSLGQLCHIRNIGAWRENWIEAAARLCRMDDGVSDRVHRLKALGNSIVPQIAFEIFKAIEEAEN